MNRLYKYMLLAGLIAAPALLSAQTYPEPGHGPEGLEFSKKVTTLEGRNKYQIDLEAFVTGTTTKIVSDVPVPVDIMLVLDISSSMKETVSTGSATEVPGPFSYSNTNGKGYKIIYDGNYCDVKAASGDYCYYLYYENGGKRTYLSGTGTTDTKPTTYLSPDATIWTGKPYYRQGKWKQVNKNTNYSYNSIASRTYYYSNSYDNEIKRGYDEVNQGCFLYFEDESGVIHYLVGDQIADTKPTERPADQSATIYTGTLYQVQTGKETKLNILKDAVNNFITTIADEAKGADGTFGTSDDVPHKIGIAVYEGLAEVMEPGLLTINSETVVTDFQDYVTGLATGSGTCSDLGLALAADQFEANPIKDGELRSRVVVMFTDGEPYYGSKRTDFPADWDSKTSTQKRHWVADNAIAISNTLINTYDATCYSIGIFDNTVDDWCYDYMHYITSEYPDAESLDSPGDREGSKVYMQTSDGSDLNDIFQTIAEESTSGTASLPLDDESTTVVDVVSESFKLPDNATGADIELYVKKCTGSHLSGVSADQKVIYEFNGEELDARELFPGITPTVNAETKEVKVTGFDFAENYVSEKFDKDGNPTYPRTFTGYKLIVRFIIEIDPNSPGGAYVNTNTIRSGIYYKNDDGKDVQIATFEIPYVKIPNLVVVKHGLHKGESAIFNMSEIMTDGSEALIENIIIVATCTEEGQPAVARVKIQEPGRYKVTESTWSWAYDLSGVTEKYDDEDSASITDDQWKEKGYDGEIYKKPTKFGTEVSKDGRYIIRNVNDFTEDKTTYKGTVFEFTNSDEARTGDKANPAHAEAINNNEFYESFKQKLL